MRGIDAKSRLVALPDKCLKRANRTSGIAPKPLAILPGEKFQTIPGTARTFSYCGLQVEPGPVLIAGSK